MKINYYLIAGLLLFLNACKKDESTPTPSPVGGYLSGIYVANEGNFLSNNASVTFISDNGTVMEDPYFDVNGVSLGDVLLQFLPLDGKGYAVVNNSQKVEVVNLKTFAHKTSITGCDYPRYLLPLSSTKGYLTNGSLAGDIKVIDLSNNTIISSIAVGSGPEKLAVSGTHVAVCNSGGWGTDNTVSIIDTSSDQVVATITVADRPNDVVVDAAGNFWVICAGETQYDSNWNITGHTAASIQKIDVNTLTVTSNIPVGSIGDHPRHLEISPDGLQLYYENNGIYSMNLSDGNAGTLLIAGAFSGINVHPATGDIWATSMSDFVSNSNVYCYSSSGILKKTFACGMGSNSVAFH